MKLVVFDVDGTLVDSQEIIYLGMSAAFDAVGLTCPPKEQVLSTVGLSLPIALARLAPDSAPDMQNRLVEAYKDAFTKSRITDSAPLYPGALECVHTLSADENILLAIATGKGRRGLLPMLEAYDLGGRFFSMQTADDHPSKPHPSMLLKVMSEAGVAPQDAVMVGDTTYDVEMAVAAGMASFGVSWGYHPAQALYDAGATKVVDEFAALTQAISDWSA